MTHENTQYWCYVRHYFTGEFRWVEVMANTYHWLKRRSGFTFGMIVKPK